MDTNNWRPTQGANGAIGDPTMESGDWRAQLQADSRQRIVNKIMDTLERHLPFSGHEGLQELKKIAVRFEEKIYTAATSQSDYLRKISLKMLTMETRSQNPMSDPMQSNSTANSVNPSDPGSQVMQQVNNQGQQLPISVQSNNMQQGQQMMSQSMHNNIGSTGMQGSTGLSSALPPGSGLQQPTMSNVAGQNSNLQNAQNMSSVQQNTVGNTMGNNNFANQRQIPGRQQLVPQQQLPQTQNSQYLYQQQQLHQMAKQKLQQPSMQPHMQQPQQQQNMLQPGHLQPSQQSVMQPTMMQTSSLSTVVQNQQPVVPQSSQPLMNHQQSVLRPQRQQPVQPIQQQVQQTQQNPIGQQTNATNMQQNQLIGQQNNYSDMQQQQQQRLIGQQNKLSSLQQPQQQLIGQHNNLSSMQPQQSGQQQQLLGNQSGNTGMQTNQHSVQQMLQSNKIPIQQQNQQSSANLLPTQVQQSQPQLQQQVMSHMQSQPGQLQQQQVGMQQQPNLLQRDMQQRLPTTGGFQQQNMIDHQKQLFQQQRAMPEASSTSLDSTATDNPNGGDWQEEVYQKIKAMKDLYLLDLNDMHQKILSKLQQHDSLPQQPKNEQLEKLKVFKNMLERFMQFLQIPKHGILANYKDKLGTYEKQIINVINSNRRKPAAPQQQAQAQALPAHMQSLQQSQQTHSQFTQVQSHESQKSLHGSTESMQPNNMGNLPQNTAVSISGGSNAQQNVMTSILPGSNLDPGQNTSINSLQPMMSQSMHNNIGSTGMQGSSNLSSALPPGSALQQPTVTHVAGQNLNLQNVRNTSSVQRSQFTGQQNNYHPMFLLQQQMMIQQRLIEQQIRLLSLQQQSQQLIGQNLNLQNLQNTSTVQELLQSNKMPIQQHYQQGSANLLPTQVQQWQPQLPQQRDMQQKVPTTGGLQQQNMIDQQKQTVTPESSETSLDSTGRIGNPNGGDWQEEVYQKIKAMKELYLQDLIDIHQIFLSILQQHDSLPQQPKNEQIEKLKLFKNVLERYMQFLQTAKHEIFENHEDKLATYEKQIINVINSNRRKPVAPQQQAQQTFSQSPQIQSHENQ